MAGPYYISQAMLENRLSAAVVRRVMDDNNDGTADANPLAQLIADAESRFEAHCSGIYPLDTLRSVKPHEAVRLVLDVAEALAARRFPRAFGRDWFPLWQATESELNKLRQRKTRLDIDSAPEPAENEGGKVFVGSAEVSDEDETGFFQDGTGIF